MPMNDGQLIVGFIRGPHGVAGEFKVESASGYYEHIAQLKEVTLRHGELSKETKVESVSLGNATAYVKFAGINSDEEAKKFNRWEILVPRKYCKPLEKDEWYIEDLRSCSLIYEGKDDPATLDAPKVLGTITDVLEGGSGYLLEVSVSESCTVLEERLKHTASGKKRKVLIPFTFQHISNVDVKNKTIQLMHLWILE